MDIVLAKEEQKKRSRYRPCHRAFPYGYAPAGLSDRLGRDCVTALENTSDYLMTFSA